MPQSGANKQPPEVRAFAASCWFKAEGDAERAAALLEEEHGPGLVQRPGSWCKRWAERFLKTGSVLDAHRSGRPRLVTADAATLRQAAKAFKAGTSDRREDGYTSIAEGVRMLPQLAALLQRDTPQVRCCCRRAHRTRLPPPIACEPLPWRLACCIDMTVLPSLPACRNAASAPCCAL